MPKGFVFSKPISQDNYDERELLALEAKGRLIITRKRNGWRLFAVQANYGNWKFYTDKMNEVCFLDHLKEIFSSHQIPNCTMLAGEAVVPWSLNESDDLARGQRIFNSKRGRALELQKQIGQVNFRPFDIIFWNGRAVCQDEGYRERIGRLTAEFGGTKHYFNRVIWPAEIVDGSLVKAKILVSNRNWEGLVVYHENFRANFRVDGKEPQRITGCWKWKPILEDDFIVRHPILDPANKNRVKEVALSQWNSGGLGRGAEFDCGKFGAFDQKTRAWLLKA